MYRQFNPNRSSGQVRSRGQLQLSIRVKSNRLDIRVHEARYLQLKSSSNCYVKLYVLPDENKSTKQKTKVLSAKGDLVFKEDFTYTIPSADGGGLRLYISLWRRDRTSRNELIGSMSFSVNDLLLGTVKVDGWYHLLTDNEGHRKNVVVGDKVGSHAQPKIVAIAAADTAKAAAMSSSWLPTKLVTLHWSPSGFGFLLQPGSPVTVSHVEEGLPAQLAGIRQGDIILQVDNNSIVGASYDKVMDLIGSRHSTLQLLVQRPNAVAPTESQKLSHKRATSGDSVFSSGSSMLSDSGIVMKKKAESSRDLYSVGREENEDYVVTPQKPFRGYISWQDMSTLEQKRQEAIVELMKFEKNYVEELCFGIERYSRPLHDHMLSEEQHSYLFCNIEELYYKASKILYKLKKRRKPFHMRTAEHPYYLTAIGDIYYEKVGELVSAYMIYMEGRQEADMELSVRRLQPDFAEFLKEPPLNEDQPTIDEFLERPTQYIGKLRTCLRKVLANTPTYHPDQSDLRVCIDNTYAKSCQDEAKAKEAAAEVYQFEKMLGFAPNVERFHIAADDRTLVHQGDLLLVEGKKRRLKRVHVMLFNDILLITKREGTLLVAQEPPLDLSCVMVQDFSSVQPNEFCITVIKRAAGDRLSMATWKASHIFQTSSVDEKNQWKHLIDERAKGVTTVRRKTNLKQFHTLDLLANTSPEEDLRQFEKEQQQRLAELAPQMYSALGYRNRVVRGTGTRTSISSGESVPSSEIPSPSREKRARPLSLFERRVAKAKQPRRRHSLTMADVGELTGTLERLLAIAHVSGDRIERWKTSLAGLLTDPDGADLFMTFLQSEFSEENLQFWQSCEELKQLRGQALHHKARQIFAKFLEPGAPAEVNIDAETQKGIAASLTSPTPDMLNMAQQVVYTLMERDSYRRFLKSNDFLILQESAKAHSSCK
ncbi:uncharacterized protein LOC134190567 isoform X2 [Corticium candelabrum]|uniref:uncharacterized protein LOC134190567 isoform X2 n=1 Tax=Corticium candelabrum TaxID=121492 RepID=UPI002E26ACA3|nr:uncharacterized protein LOC134190567 isoform X2 [Corticium candelabrum]